MEGSPFGRYQLLELLGRGGMGEVWRAFDPTMNRVVALKVLPPNFAGDEVFQERFRREARAAAGLDEPHVVPFYDFGEVEGRLYVTMRLIGGRDMQTLLEYGPLPPARAVHIIEQIALALDAAHRIGLIHRDVKPSNILVAEHDFAYLIDFGIARTTEETGLTSTGATIGTWAYMSPERLNTGRADARADIYALTCVLYEALTGQRPYPGDSLEQQIVGHLTTPPPRPSAFRSGLPAALDAVIATGMAKNPNERYASTIELAKAARSALTTNSPVDTTDDGTATVGDATQREAAQTVKELVRKPDDAAADLPTRQADTVSVGNAPTQLAPAAGSTDRPSRPHTVNPRTKYLIAALASIAVAILAVVAIAVGTESPKGGGAAAPASTPSSATTSTSALVSATTTANGPAQRLMAMVPADANCKPSNPTAGIAVAYCDGPSSARLFNYILYPDMASMNRDFDRAASSDAGSCPGIGRSPQPWHRGAYPALIGGRVLCSVDSSGQADLVWTVDNDLLYGVMFGDSGVTIQPLYDWWKAHYQ